MSVEYVGYVTYTNAIKVADSVVQKIKYYYGGKSNKNTGKDNKIKPVKVKLSAKDDASKVAEFEYEYTIDGNGYTGIISLKDDINTNNTNNEGKLSINKIDKDENTVQVICILDLTTDEANGYFGAKAVDNAGNESAFVNKDGDEYIYDNIAPDMTIKWNYIGKAPKDQEMCHKEVDGTLYLNYEGVNCALTIAETNFDKEDVIINLDGTDIKIEDKGEKGDKGYKSWQPSGENGGTFTFNISGERTHKLKITYTDKSGNIAELLKEIL